MQTIAHAPHHRKAYGAHKKVDRSTLAQYIAASIREHQRQGRQPKWSDYTADGALIKMVQTILAASKPSRPVQPPEMQAVRKAQQALLDSWMSGIK
jgi:hypothetical protein